MNKRRLTLNLILLLFACCTFAKPTATAKPGLDFRLGYSNFPIMLYNSSMPFYDLNHDEVHMFHFDYFSRNLKLHEISRFLYQYGPLTSPGQYTLEYTGAGTRWLDWTASASYTQASSVLTHARTGEVVGDYYLGHYSLMAGIRLKWVNRPAFQLYSGVNAGVTVFHEDVNSSLPLGFAAKGVHAAMTMDINWLGMSVGRKFYVFAELTSGFIGVFQTGFGYRF